MALHRQFADPLTAAPPCRMRGLLTSRWRCPVCCMQTAFDTIGGFKDERGCHNNILGAGLALDVRLMTVTPGPDSPYVL